MPNRNGIDNLLSPFFHSSVTGYVISTINQHEIHFIISKPRKTKLGDYRAIPHQNKYIITINNNLNPVQFLITVLHELAHHVTWEKYKRVVRPHGAEWKQEYQRLFMPILANEFIETPLKSVFADHLKNPKATSYSDANLNAYLNNTFDIGVKRVQDVPMDESFVLGKRTFIKEKKMRTRYLCVDLGNNKKYLIHGHTELG